MLVGRKQELNVLNDSFRQMLDGKGSVLFLTGEAGLGKTTLVHEWWGGISDPAFYAEAACSIPIGNVDVGMLEALQPWADVIVQIQAHEGDAKKKIDLKKLIHDAAPAWAWALPIVGDLAHAAVETHRLVKEQRNESSHAMNQQQVFQQYVNLITGIADEIPIVILLDDMHWADASSTNLLFYLSRQIPSKRILILATYRPDDALTSDNGTGHPIITVKNEILRYDAGKELPLGFLSGGAIHELLSKTFPEYQPNPAFEGWLQKISDGNSLFATQFIRTLQEDGHLSEHGSFTGDYDSITIPDSALAVVTERTRRLDNETRELLCYATAEGEEFTSYVLGQLTSKKPLELLRDLRKAEAAGLVQSKKGMRQFANQTTSVFGFSHALFHKALYESLLAEERDILHRQCYEILKAEWDRLTETKDRTMPLASKLFTHAEKCGEIESAIDVALEAAKGAWQVYSRDEALAMLDNAYRLLQSVTGSLSSEKQKGMTGNVLLVRVKILAMTGKLTEAFASVNDALACFESLNDESKIMDALKERSHLFGQFGKLEEAEQDARRTLALAEKLGDKPGIARGLGELANITNLVNHYEEAFPYHERAIEIWRATGDRHGEAVTLNNIGMGYSALGDSSRALQYYQQSLDISQPLDDRYLIGWSVGRIGREYHNIGDQEKALEYLERGMKIQESIGNILEASYLLNAIGGVYESQHDLDKALECYTSHYDLAIRSGNISHQAEGLNNMGQIYRDLKNYARSRECLTQALELGKKLGSTYMEGYSIGQLGLLEDVEADAATCDEKAAKKQRAIALLQQAADMYNQIKHYQAKYFEQELKRVQEKLHSAA